MLLLMSGRNIDWHGKECVILDTHSVMSRPAITGHIHISVPRRRSEIPFKERRIDLFLRPETKVQWRDNTSFGIFVATYRTVWGIGGFARIIYEVIFLNDVISAGIVTVGYVLVKIFALWYQSLFRRIADNIRYFPVCILLGVLCKYG